MQLNLKAISRAGIAEALSKAEVYRYLNEPGEAESICRDILASSPIITSLRCSARDHRSVWRWDVRSLAEAENVFWSLTNEYERIITAHPSRAKGQGSTESGRYPTRSYHL